MDSLNLNTARYRLEIELGDTVGRAILTDVYSGVVFADSDYRYSAFAESEGRISPLEGLRNPSVDEELPDRGGRIVTISGTLGEPDSQAHIGVRHRFYIPEEGDFFEELIQLQNLGTTDISLRGYRFGFRKRLEKPRAYGGPGIDIENYRLIALPFRLQPDGRKHDYQLDDVYYGRYQCSEYVNPTRIMREVVDRGRGRSEGWAWTDGENGLLVVKYNPEMIEYSMLETEGINDEVYLNFGGAAPSLYNEPFETGKLPAGRQISLGLTHYLFYEGLWRRGAYLFRDYMSGLGHGLPDNYDPPLTWNVTYNIGWRLDSDALAEHFTPEALKDEAERARNIGCDMLYLGSGWEKCEGEARWDEDRLGAPEDFIRDIRSKYGLKLGLRVIGRSYCDGYPGLYRRTFDGNTGYYAPYARRPFYEPCMANEFCRHEMLERISKIAGAGIDFMSFDAFDWRGPCFDGRHGHKVPTTPNVHSAGVMELIARLREKRPEMLIEAHDPVWPWGVRYLPVYYHHDAGRTFDEGWAFEFTNPLENLLSGRALSLLYYNLAYDLPLYLFIDMDSDNENCLAFWWYASTIRHLGIGGGKADDRRFEAYKRAIAEYKELRDLYVAGTFYALDELTHIHAIPEAGRCILNAFNLTDKPVSRTAELRPHDLGLLEEVQVEGAAYEVMGSKLVLKLEIPPFSPLMVRLFSK